MKTKTTQNDRFWSLEKSNTIKTVKLYKYRTLYDSKEVVGELEAINAFRGTIESLTDMFMFRLEFQKIWAEGNGIIHIGEYLITGYHIQLT